MSLTINHNPMAMNAQRNLESHYGDLATSTRRLSSGLRVDTAADDAAGLAVRELMRADIAAMNQGVRNANDGISAIQTADGSLEVIDNKLIRMKELAEQAATGTYTADQREVIDGEFQQMKAEINRIANQTEFNQTKLIDGSLTGDQAMKVHFGPRNNDGEDFYYVDMGDATAKGLDIANTHLDSAAERRMESTANNLHQIFNELDNLQSGETPDNPEQIMNDIGDAKYQMEGLLADLEKAEEKLSDDQIEEIENFRNLKANINAAISELDDAITEYENEGADDADWPGTITDHVEEALDSIGYEDMERTIDLDSVDVEEGESYSVNINGETFTAIVGSGESSDELAENLAREINNHENFSAEASGGEITISEGAGISDISVEGFNSYLTFDAEDGMFGNDSNFESGADQNFKLTVFAGGEEIVLSGDTDGASGYMEAIDNMFSGAGTQSEGDVQFDIAVSGSEVSIWAQESGGGDPILLDDVRFELEDSGGDTEIAESSILSQGRGPTTEGEEDINDNVRGFGREYDEGMATYQPTMFAQEALETIDAAIEEKDKIRADLGAYQNRLDNTVSNLQIQAENLQAAESRISDVDVAHEMTQFTRNQVLSQGATAMLAQANTLPQMAMQLMG